MGYNFTLKEFTEYSSYTGLHIYYSDGTDIYLKKSDLANKTLPITYTNVEKINFGDADDSVSETYFNGSLVAGLYEDYTLLCDVEASWSHYKLELTGTIEESTTTTPDLRQYSLINYEFKEDKPLYYKFTFSLDDVTEYEITIYENQTMSVVKTEFAKKSDIPTKTSQLTNDSGYLTEESDPTVPSWAKASSKPSYSYSEITGKPTIPTVYNSKITIQKNGSSVGEFTLNASSDKSINITVHTKLTELSNTESKFVSETYLVGALADYAKKEDLESIAIPQTENKVTEEVTISSNTWVKDTNVSPFSYIATINLTNLKASSTSIELLNNNAILFATFGFAIGSVSESSVIIYSIDKPTEDVTLTFEVVNPVEGQRTYTLYVTQTGPGIDFYSVTYSIDSEEGNLYAPEDGILLEGIKEYVYFYSSMLNEDSSGNVLTNCTIGAGKNGGVKVYPTGDNASIVLYVDD